MRSPLRRLHPQLATAVVLACLVGLLVGGIGVSRVATARASGGTAPSVALGRTEADGGYVSTAPPCGLGCDPTTQTAPAQGEPSPPGETVVDEPGENGSFALIIAFVLAGGATVWGLTQLVTDRRRAGTRKRVDARRRRRARAQR